MPPKNILHDNSTLRKHAASILKAISPLKSYHDKADKDNADKENAETLMSFYGSKLIDAAVSQLYAGVGQDWAAYGLYHSSTSYNIPWESFPMAAMMVSSIKCFLSFHSDQRTGSHTLLTG